MGRDNYGFQKRSRELAKKKKKEEKKLRKQAKAGPEGGSEVAESPNGVAEETPTAEMPAEPETPSAGTEEGSTATDS